MARKKKRKNSKEFRTKFQGRFLTKSSVIALVIGVIIFAVAVTATVRLHRREAELDKTISELNTQIDEVTLENEDLREEKENLDTDSFKERIAREILGMIGKDEYLLKESEDEASEKSATTQEETTSQKDADGTTSQENDEAQDAGE